MLSYEEIMNYCSNYKIDNGIVIDKNTNQQVIDEEIVLRVKTSILIFKESKDAYQSDIQQFGKTNKSQEDYIKKTMEKFGVNNESNSYGINKLVNAILNSNGHYEEMMSGNDLKNSKFSILIAPKNEYGMAYLKLKFREKGLDIELPVNYYPDDDCNRRPVLSWRSHANNLYTNWLNYYVYQITPYILEEDV